MDSAFKSLFNGDRSYL